MNRSIALLLLFVAACSPAEQQPEESSVALKPTNLIENEIAVPDFADFLAVDGDSVWVTNRAVWSNGLRRYARVDRDASPLRTMAILSVHCGWRIARMAICIGSISDGESRNDDRHGHRQSERETNVVAGAGSIWVPSGAEGKIARVDPETNAVIAAIDVTPQTFFLAFALMPYGPSVAMRQSIQRIDPATNLVTNTAELANSRFPCCRCWRCLVAGARRWHGSEDRSRNGCRNGPGQGWRNLAIWRH